MKAALLLFLLATCWAASNGPKQDIAFFKHLSSKYSGNPIFTVLNYFAEKLQQAQHASHAYNSSLFGLDYKLGPFWQNTLNCQACKLTMGTAGDFAVSEGFKSFIHDFSV